jgi:putative oxidoreductase
MMARLKGDVAPLVLRLALATIFISHGYFKLQLDNGAGWTTELSPLTARAVAWGEVVGGFALGVGLLTRLAALGIAVIQVGAIVLVTWGREFISVGDLFAKKVAQGFRFAEVGYEYNFALVAMCLAVMLLGSGMFSLDHLIWPRLFGARQGKADAAAAQPVAAQVG